MLLSYLTVGRRDMQPSTNDQGFRRERAEHAGAASSGDKVGETTGRDAGSCSCSLLAARPPLGQQSQGEGEGRAGGGPVQR